jgi:protocatechuate 3,4-dioxygenase beta subunit
MTSAILLLAASISGSIVQMGNGAPLSKANVTLSPFNGGTHQSYTATTTADGQFSFPGIDPGQYRLSAARSGFVRMEYGARKPNLSGLPLTVSDAQKLTGVLLQMTPAGTIAGRVFDRDGEPRDHVLVSALKYSYQEGRRTVATVQVVQTNDLGEYRLYWLQPGKYFVSATPPAESRPPGNEARDGFVTVYYPGTMNSESASPIDLPPGIVFSGVDLTVARVPLYRVEGQVMNGATGQPAPNVSLMLEPAGGRTPMTPASSRQTIDDKGHFRLEGIVPGSYELSGLVSNQTVPLTARMHLEIGNADVQNVSLNLMPGFMVKGTLRIEGQVSQDEQNLGRIRVMLRPATQGGGANPSSTVSSDGTFTIPQVPSGDYRITVTGMPQNAYIKAARYDGTDVLNEGLRLDRESSASLEVIVGADAPTINGTVQNEKQEGAAGVTVVLIPDPPLRARFDLYRMGSTDASGRFHIEGVPPGNYRAFSWEWDVEMGAWQDPDFIRDFDNRGKPVRINEGATSNIDLIVIPQP